jgi:hypothetical protein
VNVFESQVPLQQSMLVTQPPSYPWQQVAPEHMAVEPWPQQRDDAQPPPKGLQSGMPQPPRPALPPEN